MSAHESQDIVGLAEYLPDRDVPSAPQPQGVERIATPRADGEASCSLCSEDFVVSLDHDNDSYCPDCWADEPGKAPSERPSALDERGES